MATIPHYEDKTPYISNGEVEDDDEELLTANGIEWRALILDIFIAILPLYFVGFAIAAYIRDGTLANSVRNAAIFQMAKLNPTIFPILFTVIFAKFLKAIANWKLERGVTVGHMQHLLGSRSLVNSVLTPIKLRTLSITVPILIMVWALNPIGGQLSLRTVSRESHFRPIATQFRYADPGRQIMPSASASETEVVEKTIDAAFNSALMAPDSTKNGSQDAFGNLHIPMIEYLQSQGTYQDAEGWFYTAPQNLSRLENAAYHALNISTQSAKLYASLIGVPFNPVASNTTAGTSSSRRSTINTFVQDLEKAYLGADVVATTLNFTLETSYMYSDCELTPSLTSIPVGTTEDNPMGNQTAILKSSFPNGTSEISSNERGFMVSYDSNHTINSTVPRNIGIGSLLTNFTEMGDELGNISQAWCNISTTYVEVDVHCYSQSNCTVYRIRPSKNASTYPSFLTVLDGISAPSDWIHYNAAEASVTPGMYSSFINYPFAVASKFFDRMINITQTPLQGPHNFLNLGPLEMYFLKPSAPFTQNDGTVMAPISVVGNDLISRRFTQLINTCWAASSQSDDIVNGLNPDGEYPTANGYTTIESIVLHCHKIYNTILIIISLGLVGLGLAAAYLEAIRRGPDVLDDFVNSLRHSPYVHEPIGNSMQDGKDIVQRLKSTVVQMGDVRPDQPVGYVAIGTPNDVQRVDRLDTERKYV